MDKDNIDNISDDGSDYEELTEDQLNELNMLSSNRSDPFSIGLDGRPIKNTTSTPAATAGVWGNLSHFITQQKDQPAQQQNETEENGEDEDGEDDDLAGEIIGDLKTLTISHAKQTAYHLVIDTNAILHSSARLDTLGKELYTIQEVLDEVRDKKTQAYLETFPFEIKTKQPTPESYKAVVEFSQKTGDFATLSVVDLKVLALAHTLHCEYDTINTLKSSPEPTKPPPRPINNNNTNNNNNKNTDQQKKKKKNNNKKNKNKKKEIVDTCCSHDHKEEVEKKEVKDTCCSHDHKETEKKETAAPVAVDTCCAQTTTEPTLIQSETSSTTTQSTEESTTTTQQKKGKKNNKKNSLLVNMDELPEEDPSKFVDPREILEKMKKQREAEEEERRKKRRDKEDEGEWITPENVHTKMNNYQTFSNEQDEKHVKVGCITSDFSMQNVMLQMGLNLLSVDGLIVKQVKQFVWKCYACNTTTLDFSKIWCPSCGNQTMVKAMTWVDRYGNVRVGKGSGKQFNNRGKIFSVPKARGGKRHTDLVFTEDQYIHRLKVTGQYYKKKKQPADGAVGDDTFESSFSYAKPTEDVVIGFGHRNPNIARRKIGKKNKSISNH